MKQSTGELGPNQLAWCRRTWQIFALSAKQVRDSQDHAESERRRIERANREAGTP